MNGKRVLFVSSEVSPYLAENEISTISFEAPKMVNSIGGQTRIFMPRFGNINERRHQLYEVIRLSGMNLVINDLDMPLIIKVASIPKERMQVYFIDNEDYFKRKATFTDEDGHLFKDNDERAIFFAKGVLETVKKLNWAPDIIHINGWLASLLPLYLRNYYGNEPLYKQTKIVTSIYDQDFEGILDHELKKKVQFDGIDDDVVDFLKQPSYINLMKVAAQHSDAIIWGSENIKHDIKEYVDKLGLAQLNYVPREEFQQAYQNFYQFDVLGLDESET
jgi:starch synthase